MTTSNSWYRSNLWRWKGMREYTKQGYEVAAVNFDANDLDVDCTGRHYMITGCNSGIGFEIATEVARRGGILHMVCRNPVAAKEARASIITNTGNDKIHLHTLDLSRPRDVTRWARDFVASNHQLHVLVNNAGCMVHERRIDEDGIETNFAVNTLAIHILVMTMLPLLQRSADSRVVTVSSAGMLTVKLDPYDLQHENMDPFNGTLVYGQNKRQEIVMTLHYAMKYDKVQFSVMHPGWADTVAVRTSIPAFWEAMKDVLRTGSQGADTAVWLTMSKSALKHPSGLFFQDRVPVSPHLPLAWTRSSQIDEDFLMKSLDEFFTTFTSELTPLSASPKPTAAKVSDISNNNVEEEEIKIENLNNISENVTNKSEDKHQQIEDLTNHVKNVDLKSTALSVSESTTVKDATSELLEPVQNGIMTEANNVVVNTENSSHNEDVKVSTEKVVNETESSVEEKLESVHTKVEENFDNIALEKAEEKMEVKDSQNVEDLLQMDTSSVVNETKTSVEGNLESIVTKVEENIDNETIEKTVESVGEK